jgi:hypothetical protein
MEEGPDLECLLSIRQVELLPRPPVRVRDIQGLESPV